MKLLTYVWIDFPQNESHADVTLLLMIFVLTFLFWMLTGLYMIQIVHTWFSKDLSRKSCIDYWLTSDFISSFIKSSSICPAPLTDHAFIDLILSDSGAGCHRNPGYWKLNCSLLQIPSYCLGIKSIIEEFKAKPGVSVSSNWEMFKYECRKFSIRYSKQLAKEKSLKYTSILSEMNQI